MHKLPFSEKPIYNNKVLNAVDDEGYWKIDGKLNILAPTACLFLFFLISPEENTFMELSPPLYKKYNKFYMR